MPALVKIRRGVKSSLPTLQIAEFGFATDTNELFIGSASGNIQLCPRVHTHTEGDLSLSDVTTNNATTSKHGFLPKLSGDTSHFLRGDGQWAGVNINNVWYVLNSPNENVYYAPSILLLFDTASTFLVQNRIYYMPFIPPINVTLTKLGVYMGQTASGSMQVGVYNSSNYRPNSRLGYVSLSTSTQGFISGNVNISLVGGQLYFLALICGVSNVSVVAANYSVIPPILGIDVSSFASITFYYQSGSGGTLPPTAGEVSVASNEIPLIFIRYTV